MMNKEELRELARLGMPKKLRDLEETLRDWHSEFPELFLSQTPPQLLKPELRSNGHGHWGGYRQKATISASGKRLGRPPKKARAPKQSYSSKIIAMRTRSAAILDYVGGATGPVTHAEIIAAVPGATMRSMAPLTRRGYLRHTSKGFTRTSREFIISKYKTTKRNKNEN